MIENDMGKRRKRRLVYGLAILVAFMLLFTVIARAASAFTTTRVTTEAPMPRKLEHVVSATGVTEKNRELAVLTQENLMVETIYVSEGESVQPETLLAQLSMDSIEEELKKQEEELELLQLQLAAARENEGQAASQRKLALQRATEDYERTCQEQEEALEAARGRYLEAVHALELCGQGASGSQNPPMLWVPGGGQGQEPGGEPGQMAGGEPEGETGQTSGGGPEGEPGPSSEGEPGEENGRQPDGESEGNQEPDAAEDAAREQQEQMALLQQELQEAEAALRAAEQGKADACRSAARALEDARMKSASDYSVQMAEISVSQKERAVEELKQMQQDQGQVLAPVEGVVTQVHLAVGQKTTDTAAFTMADLTSGLRYVAKISKEEAAYVAVGDTVTLKAAGKEVAELTVCSMEETEDGQVQVTVLVPAGSISMGQYAQMEVLKRSREYGATLPLTAIRTENGKKYVYVMEETETVLGVQYVARSIEVEILEQNERYAAIAEGLLGTDSLVIVSSDNFLQAGDTVRLQEE